jgi:signal recognition particle receptor subunit beta
MTCSQNRAPSSSGERYVALINLAAREINYKIVYYGCGLCGKTTNIQYIHKRVNPAARGRLVSIATEEERTLYFDFLPLSLGTVKGLRTRFHLYTVPGQSFYNASRKLVLQGVDGIVFVADSQVSRLDENVDSYLNLWDNLRSQSEDLSSLGMVLQMNKRDLGNIFSVADLTELLNHTGSPVLEACALTGVGVFETLKTVCKQVIAKSSRS